MFNFQKTYSSRTFKGFSSVLSKNLPFSFRKLIIIMTWGDNEEENHNNNLKFEVFSK